MAGLFHQWRHPRRCYVICGIARSGSNLLSDGLRETGRAGRPNQYFLPSFESYFRERQQLPTDITFVDYLRAIIKRTATSNEVFGFKLMPWYLDKFLLRLRLTNAFGGSDTSEMALLQNAFPRLQFIRIARRNKLRQAISKARAIQTGLWKVQTGKGEIDQAQFDRDLIAKSLRVGEEEEKVWGDFFARNKLEPFPVEYEELCRDYDATIRAVLKFLQIRLPRGQKIGAPVTKKQSDAISGEWERLYNASNAT